MRLPKTLLPEAYCIFLTPFMSQGNKTIQGRVEIDIKVEVNNVSVITLHSENLNIFENLVTVVDNNNKNYKVVGFGYEDSTKFLMIHLAEEFTGPIVIKLFTAVIYSSL